MSLNCAVIGNPISHSLSPVIHRFFAEQANLSLHYETIQGDDCLFEQQARDFFTGGGKGLNVTLPYKQRAFALAEVASERCYKAGVANTLWWHDNKVHADNTDGIGLIRDLGRHMRLQDAHILILGAGGAARGIIHPLLAEQPHRLVVVNRSMQPLRQLQKDIPQLECWSWQELRGCFDLIINATSASLVGEPIRLPASLLSHSPFCYDLTYSMNVSTSFVSLAHQHGCQAVDGLGMLIEQAAEAFYIWHGIKPDTPSKSTLLNTLSSKKNGSALSQK